MSRCPACHGSMTDSPWCPYCSRCWEVMVYDEALPKQEPVKRSSRGNPLFERCLSDRATERIIQELLLRRKSQVQLAREYYCSVATVNRIAARIGVVNKWKGASTITGGRIESPAPQSEASL